MTRRGKVGQAAGPADKERPRWTPADLEQLASWFDGKTAAELDVLEEGGRALYGETLKRRDPATGQLVEQPIRLRVPNTLEKARARLNALKWLKELAKRTEPLTWTEAQDLLGAAYVDELDTLAILAESICDADKPHGQFADLEILAGDCYPKATLWDVWDRLNWYQDFEDIRVDHLNEEAFQAAILAIDRVRNLSPLLVTDGATRDSFVLSMAYRLASSLKSKSSSQPTAPSTQAN